MKFLITAEFHSEYALIEAPDKETAEVYIIDMLNHNEPDEEVTEIAGCDEYDYDELEKEADEVLFIEDYDT